MVNYSCELCGKEFSQKSKYDYDTINNKKNTYKFVNYVGVIKCLYSDINSEQLNEYIINNEILNDNTKQLLFEYIANDEIHSIIGLSFK